MSYKDGLRAARHKAHPLGGTPTLYACSLAREWLVRYGILHAVITLLGRVIAIPLLGV